MKRRGARVVLGLLALGLLAGACTTRVRPASSLFGDHPLLIVVVLGSLGIGVVVVMAVLAIVWLFKAAFGGEEVPDGSDEGSSAA